MLKDLSDLYETFGGPSRAKLYFMRSLFTWFSSHIFLNIKPSKIFFSTTAEQIEGKLYRYDCVSIRNKKLSTYDIIICHMVWQPNWFFLKTFKNHLLQNGLTDRGETSHTCSPSHGDTSVSTNNALPV